MSKGPAGSGFIKGALASVLFASLFLVLGVTQEVSVVQALAADDVAAKWTKIYLGCALLAAAFFLFLTGQIIRAVSAASEPAHAEAARAAPIVEQSDT